MSDSLTKHLLESGSNMPKRFRHNVYVSFTCTVLSWNWTHVFFRRDDNNRKSKRLIGDFFKEWKPDDL